MDIDYEKIRMVSDLSAAIRCIGFLAGLAAGVFLIVRKRMLPGILAMAAFILFSLGSIVNILAFRVFFEQIVQADLYESISIATSCITGIADILACAALIAAFILLLRPAPPPPDNTFYPS